MFPLFTDITEFDNRSLFERSIIGLSGDLITELFFLSDSPSVLYLLYYYLTLLLDCPSIYGSIDFLFLLQMDYLFPPEPTDSKLDYIEF